MVSPAFGGTDLPYNPPMPDRDYSQRSDVVFRLLHPTGLVDVKVCSVNETWSALKWVYRKKDR